MVTGVPAFTELIQDLCARVVASPAIMALVAGKSIYKENFDCENFIMNHIDPGIWPMTNAGPNTNSPQY